MAQSGDGGWRARVVQNGGWVKLWRKLRDNPHLQDAIQLAVFVRMLLEAETEPHERRHAHGVATVARGQCIIAERTLADELNVGRQQIRRALGNLKKGGLINPQTNPHHTLITISNFDKYQAVQPTDQPRHQPKANPDPTQLLEEEEEEEGKNKNHGQNGAAKPDLLAGFDSWWLLWTIPGTKRGKGTAQRAYKTARKTVPAEILADQLKAHVRRWNSQGTDLDYIPHPASWLNGKRWEDDLRQTIAGKPHKDAAAINLSLEDYQR